MKNFNIYKDNEGNLCASPNKELLEKIDTLRYNINFKKSNLPFYINDYDINTYIGKDVNKNIYKINKFIQNFSNKFIHIHIYIYGPNSTQKTTIASYVGRELLKKGYLVKFILMNNLIKFLQDYMFERENEELSKEYKCILNSDYLIIDDSFDPKKVTVYKSGYQIPFLDSFLRERLEILNKSTCFTSNIQVDNIQEDIYSISIKQLMKRNVQELFFNENINLKDDFEINDLWK